jgi:hypothetical protein
MGLYLINIALIVLVWALLFVNLRFRQWLRWRRSQILQPLRTEVEAAEQVSRESRDLIDYFFLPSSSDEKTFDAALYHRRLRELKERNRQSAMRLVGLQATARNVGTMRHLSRLLDIATTVVAFIPLGLAVYNVFDNNQSQALTFGLLGVAWLVVTKGGSLVLSLVLKPAIMGASGYVGAQVAKKVMDERKKEQPPTR